MLPVRDEGLTNGKPANPALAPARADIAAGRLAAAALKLRERIAAAPADAEARALLAETHLQRREYRQAAFQAREALRIDPRLGGSCAVLIANAEQHLGNMLADPESEGLLWHVGRQVARYPDRRADFDDLPSLVDKFVLPGLSPGAQAIRPRRPAADPRLVLRD